MQAPRFLHKLLTSSLPIIHAKRMKALLDMVGVLLGEQRLTLTALGRALPGPVDPKHTSNGLIGYWAIATFIKRDRCSTGLSHSC